MAESSYQIDVDVHLVPGRGYAASYVVTDLDGTVIHRRLIAKRFPAYSEAMVCALEVAKATAATLGTLGASHASHRAAPLGERPSAWSGIRA